MKTLTFVFTLTALFYASLPAQTSNPQRTVVPFGSVAGLVIVKAEVDDQKGFFILDTGTPDLMLNRRIFKGEPTGEVFYGIHDAGMKVEIKPVRLTVNSFQKELEAKITDFTAIEAHTGLPVFGAIGNSVFENCEIVFDYIFKELTIYQLDKNGNPIYPRRLHEPPLEILPFQLKGSMPSVEVLAGGQVLRMGLDSGAGVNLIDKKVAASLTDCLAMLGEKEMASFGTETSKVSLAQLQTVQIGNIQCLPMQTFLVSLKKLNRDLPGAHLDGILGYEFLSKYRVAINFWKQEVYIWDSKYVQEQLAAKGKAKPY